MSLLLDGIKIGLALSLLVGPIFFALIQTGVEEGVKAGTMVGLGIWISDFLFIAGVYWGLSFIQDLTSSGNLALYMGLIGSVILTIFGLWTFFSRPNLAHYRRFKPIRSTSYLSLWLKGFLINTANPFTLLFWIGVSGTVVLKGGLNGAQSALFFAGLLGTIVMTDVTKVYLAKKIRRFMRPKHFFWMRRISGVALMVFGVALLLRVVVFVN